MKTVTIYTDGVFCPAKYGDVPTRSPLRGNRSGMTKARRRKGVCL